MFDNHLAVSVGDPRKQVSHGSVNLLVILFLGPGDGLWGPSRDDDCSIRWLSKLELCFFDDGFSYMMADTMDLVSQVVCDILGSLCGQG